MSSVRSRSPEVEIPEYNRPPEAKHLRRVYIWDLVVRLTHWAVVFSILVLAVTGIYIGRPFGETAGPAGQHFLMGTMKVIHYWASMVFSAAIFGRIVWALVTPGPANWREMLPVEAERRRKMVGTFLFYIFLRNRPPSALGHNPLAGFTYLAVFSLYGVMILTGLIMFGASAGGDSLVQWMGGLAPYLGGLQIVRLLHHVVMWLLIGFSVHHVFSGLLVSAAEKNGTMDSILSGYKWVTEEELADARARWEKQPRRPS